MKKETSEWQLLPAHLCVFPCILIRILSLLMYFVHLCYLFVYTFIIILLFIYIATYILSSIQPNTKNVKTFYISLNPNVALTFLSFSLSLSYSYLSPLHIPVCFWISFSPGCPLFNPWFPCTIAHLPFLASPFAGQHACICLLSVFRLSLFNFWPISFLLLSHSTSLSVFFLSFACCTRKTIFCRSATHCRILRV